MISFLQDASSPSPAEKEKPKVKLPKPKTPKTIIDEVTETELLLVLDEHEHTAILFYSQDDKKFAPVLEAMEQLDMSGQDLVIVRYIVLHMKTVLSFEEI